MRDDVTLNDVTLKEREFEFTKPKGVKNHVSISAHSVVHACSYYANASEHGMGLEGRAQ